MKNVLFYFILMSLSCLSALGQIEGPFSVSADLEKEVNGFTLTVSYLVNNESAYLYKDEMGVEDDKGVELLPVDEPVAKTKYDQYLAKEVEVYTHGVEFKYFLQGDVELPLTIRVRFQGCDEALCYRPVEKEISLGSGLESREWQSDVSAGDDSGTVVSDLAARFHVASSAAGYLGTEEFLGFLDKAEEDGYGTRNGLGDIFEKKGLWALIPLIILFGLGLNLTPCVLPMIPVNIAIIGAGAQAGSRIRGFGLGATYGLGISLAYGLLGVLFVLTGTRFGTLNASPMFNIAIGIVFLVLSLAMFGVFNIDLTRFQGKVDAGGGNKGSFATAFVLGLIAALLAGACVAPVLISTLVLALDIYNKGNFVGLLLPFLLGVGMALPWPFAGAGLAFLPRAGVWMEKVKYGFGVIIILAAVYYVSLGARLAIGRSDMSGADKMEEQVAGMNEGWYSSLEEGMQIAEKEEKPIFVDFWASWCKNCLKMEKTTFQDEEVLRRLDKYVRVKFDASRQSDKAVKAVLDRYVQVGLPTYIVLRKNE